MAGFLRHLVQRTLAVAPAIVPRLAGPYEESREAAVIRAEPTGEDAVPTLRFARGQAQLPAESLVAPVDGISRETFASGPQGHPENAHRQPVAATMPANADGPAVRDLHSEQLVPRANVAAAATRLLRQPKIRPGSLEREMSLAPEQRSNAHAPGDMQPSPSPALAVASRWPTEVSPTQPPALRHGNPPATHGDVGPPLNGGESPRRQSPEPIGAPRFEPTGRLSQPNAEGGASQSSIAPSVDPSSVIPIDGQKSGMLVEPPAPPAMPQLTSDDAQLHRSPRLSAATTVHVTIGRIELRAAAPAAAPAPLRPAANRPALSLADYLEQRKTAGPR